MKPYTFDVPANEVKQFAADNCIRCILCTPAENTLGCSLPGGQPFIHKKGDAGSTPFHITGNWICVDLQSVNKADHDHRKSIP